MDWVLHTTNSEGDVNLDLTREHPSLTGAAPGVTKRCIRDFSIDGIGNLPGHLRQTKTRVQNRVQAWPPIDNRGDVDHFAVRTGDAILIQKDLPVLIALFPDRNFGNGKLRHLCNILKAGDNFTNGDISGIEIRGVIRPAK